MSLFCLLYLRRGAESRCFSRACEKILRPLSVQPLDGEVDDDLSFVHMNRYSTLLRTFFVHLVPYCSYMCNIVCVQLLVLCKNYELLCNFFYYSSW